MSDAARLMDGIYAYQRHIYDLTRKYYLLGRDEAIASLQPPPGGSVLEIGCGTARNLVAIGRRYPLAACYGVDISTAMLATASRKVERAGLANRVRLAQGDATGFDPQALFGRETFDRVLISYALSMIPRWQEVLAHASTLIAPGGALQVVDFGDQGGLPRAFKALLEGWLARFHVTPRITLPQEIDRLARERGLVAFTQKRYRGYSVSARIVQAL